jgi:HEPN domain-containing protein
MTEPKDSGQLVRKENSSAYPEGKFGQPLTEVTINVAEKANAIMVYCFNCLQEGPPFSREAIERILRAK